MSIERTPRQGIDFPDGVRLEARRLAWFRCCVCRERMGDDVHHIVPKEEGGQGVLDNAVLLCVLCHGTYGHRKDKRLQLRQARDQWYEIVANRHKSGTAAAEILALQDLATKNDIAGLTDKVTSLFNIVITGLNRGSTSTSDVVGIGSSMVNSITPYLGHSSMSFTRQCENCGSSASEVAMFCWRCGQPLD